MVGTMTDWLPAVWTQLWQVTLLIVVVCFINRTLARNRPHLASVLWLLVLIKCVTPPLWSSPSSVFSWLQSGSAAEHVSTLPAENEVVETDVPSRDNIVVQIVRSDTAVSAAAADQAAHSSPRPSGIIPDWTSLVSTMWLAGMLGFAGVTILRGLVCWRRLRRAGEIHVPELVELTNLLRRQLGVRLPVRVLVSRSPVGPAVVGLFRPTVVLPALIVEAKSIDELKPLVAHELVHIRRGDLWVGLLQVLAQSLWWFHPLVRVVNRLLTRDAERCCDEEVIARLGCDPAQYARSLIDVLALKRTLQIVPAVPGVRPVDVTSQRLERIMKLGQGCHKRTPRYCWAVLLLAALITLPGGALIIAGDEPLPQPVPEPPRAVNVVETKLATEEATKPLNSNSTSVYDVNDLVEKMQKELPLNGQQARKWLEGMLLRAAVPGNSTGTFEPRQHSPMPSWDELGARATKIFWDHTKHHAIINSSNIGHSRIQAELKSLRKYGFQQVSIETRLISGPAANAATIPADWKVLDLSIAADQPATNLSDDLKSTEDLPTTGGNAGKIQGRVESVIEKRYPTMLALADHEFVKGIVDTAQGNARTNILWAPKVTLFNGQIATIEDLMHRPFVVGVEHKHGQPAAVVRNFDYGWSLRCRPCLQPNSNTIQLDLNMVLKELLSLEKATLSVATAGAVHSVQVPEQATTRIQTHVNMPLDQTLLIGGLTMQSSDGKTREPFLVLIRVRQIEPNPDPVNTATLSSPKSQPIQNVAATVPATGDKHQPDSDLFSDSNQAIQELVKQFNELLRARKFSEAEQVVKKASELVQKSAAAESEKPQGTEFSLPVGFRAARAQVRNMELRLAKAREVTRAEEGATGQPENQSLQTRVYNVADLVIPIDSEVTVRFDCDAKVTKQAQKVDPKPASFVHLIELMHSTVEPDSWDVQGGPASASPFESTLSLVIRHSEEGHLQISELLSQLRGLQSMQISLEMERMEVSMQKLREWSNTQRVTYGPNVLSALDSNQPTMTISRSANELLRSADGVKITTLPKVTIFNSQRLRLHPGLTDSETRNYIGSLDLLPVVSPVLQKVIRMNVSATSNADTNEPIGHNQFVTMIVNQPLLIDVSRLAWTNETEGVPMLEKVPYVSRLFRKTNTTEKVTSRQFIVVTPRIIVAPEKEVETSARPQSLANPIAESAGEKK